jgi:hypothetical protein
MAVSSCVLYGLLLVMPIDLKCMLLLQFKMNNFPYPVRASARIVEVYEKKDWSGLTLETDDSLRQGWQRIARRKRLCLKLAGKERRRSSLFRLS